MVVLYKGQVVFSRIGVLVFKMAEVIDSTKALSINFETLPENWIQSIRLFVWLTSSSTTRLYRGRAPKQSVWQFYVLPHMRQSKETMTSVSAGHIILTPTQPVGSGRPQRESNPGPPHQESRALPTELPCPRQSIREGLCQQREIIIKKYLGLADVTH